MSSREEQIKEIISWYKAYHDDAHSITTIFQDQLDMISNYVDSLKNTLAPSNSDNVRKIEHYSSIIEINLRSRMSSVGMLTDSAINDVKKNFVLEWHNINPLLKEMSDIKLIITQLQLVLKKLSKKKFYAKEFSYLKKFLSTISENYAFMQSAIDELMTIAGETISENYEDVIDLLNELSKISYSTEQFCIDQFMSDDYENLPSVIPVDQSATMCLFAFQDLINSVGSTVLNTIQIINGFTSKAAYGLQANLNAQFELEHLLSDVPGGSKIFPNVVSRQLRKAMEELRNMVDKIVKSKPERTVLENVRRELTSINYMKPNFAKFSDSEINAVHTFFDECSSSLDKIPHLAELIVGGLVQMADYLHEESIKYEQDYIDLSYFMK